MIDLNSDEACWLPKLAFLIIAVTIGIGLLSAPGPASEGNSIDYLQFAGALLK